MKEDSSYCLKKNRIDMPDCADIPGFEHGFFRFEKRTETRCQAYEASPEGDYSL